MPSVVGMPVERLIWHIMHYTKTTALKSNTHFGAWEGSKEELMPWE